MMVTFEMFPWGCWLEWSFWFRTILKYQTARRLQKISGCVGGIIWQLGFCVGVKSPLVCNIWFSRLAPPPYDRVLFCVWLTWHVWTGCCLQAEGQRSFFVWGVFSSLPASYLIALHPRTDSSYSIASFLIRVAISLILIHDSEHMVWDLQCFL